MARFNLSFLSILLVLAVLAVSMPVKRDEPAASGPLSLGSTVDQIKGATRIMDGLGLKKEDHKDTQEERDAKAKKEQEKKEQEKKDEEEIMAKVNKKIEEGKNGKSATPTPTAHKKKLSSGTFATPTATATHKPQSKPNELSKIPIVGGILGGSGVGL